MMPAQRRFSTLGPARGKLLYPSQSIPLAEERLADKPVSARTRLKVEELAYDIEQHDLIFRLHLFWELQGKAIALLLLSAVVVCFFVLPLAIQVIFSPPLEYATTSQPNQVVVDQSASSVCFASPLITKPTRSPLVCAPFETQIVVDSSESFPITIQPEPQESDQIHADAQAQADVPTEPEEHAEQPEAPSGQISESDSSAADGKLPAEAIPAHAESSIPIPVPAPADADAGSPKSPPSRDNHQPEQPAAAVPEPESQSIVPDIEAILVPDSQYQPIDLEATVQPQPLPAEAIPDIEAVLVPDLQYQPADLDTTVQPQPLPAEAVVESTPEPEPEPEPQDEPLSCVSEQPVAVSRSDLPTLHIPSETYSYVDGVPDWQVYAAISAVAFFVLGRFAGVRRKQDEPSSVETSSPMSREVVDVVVEREAPITIQASQANTAFVDGVAGSPKKQDSAFLDDVPPSSSSPPLSPLDDDPTIRLDLTSSLGLSVDRSESPDPHDCAVPNTTAGDDSFASSSASASMHSSTLSSSGDFSIIHDMGPLPPSCPPSMFLHSLPPSVPASDNPDSARASVILDQSPMADGGQAAGGADEALGAYDLVQRGRTTSRSAGDGGLPAGSPVAAPANGSNGQSASVDGSDGGSDSGQDVSEPAPASVPVSTLTAAKSLRRTSRSASISSVRTAFYARASPSPSPLPAAKDIDKALIPPAPSAIPVPVARQVDKEFFEQGGRWVHVVQRKPNMPQVVSVPGHADANGAQVQLAIQRVELPLSRDRRPAVPGAQATNGSSSLASSSRIRSSSEVSNMSRVSSTSTLGSSYSDENGEDRNVSEMGRQVAASNGLLAGHVPRPGVSGIPTLRPQAGRANSSSSSLIINGSAGARQVPMARSSSLNANTQYGQATAAVVSNGNGHGIDSPPSAPFLSGSYIEVDSSASPTAAANRPSTPPAAPLTPSRIPLPTSSPSAFTRIIRPPTATTTAVRGPIVGQQEQVDVPQLKRTPSDNMITVQQDERMYWTKRWEMVLSKVPNETREFLGSKFTPFQESTLNVFNRYDSGSDARGFGAESYWSSMVREKATGHIHVAHVYEDPTKAHAVQKWSALVSKYFLSSSSTPSSPTLHQHPSSPTLQSHELRGRSFSMRTASSTSTTSTTAAPQRARSPVSATSSTTSVSLASSLVYNQVEILPLASGQGCVRITPLYLAGPMHLMSHADEHAHDNSPDMLARIVLKTLAPLLKVMDQLYKLRDHQQPTLSRTKASSAPTSLLEEALHTDWTVGHILHPVAVHHASPISRQMTFRYMTLDMVPTSVAADKHRSSCALLADFLCQTLNEEAVKADEWLHVDRPESKPDARRIRYVLARLAAVQDAQEFRDVRKLVSRLYRAVSKEQQREAARGVDGQVQVSGTRAMAAPPSASAWSSSATLVD